MTATQRQSFFALRIVFAVVSSFVEAKFYRSVADCVHERVGRYMLFMLLFNAGMWNATTGELVSHTILRALTRLEAFLPSTFAMYTTMLAMSYFIFPTSLTGTRLPHTFSSGMRRTLLATLSFAAGAVVGWPFAILLAVPFVFEELFLEGADNVDPSAPSSWWTQRITRLVTCGLVASLIIVSRWPTWRLCIVLTIP